MIRQELKEGTAIKISWLDPMHVDEASASELNCLLPDMMVTRGEVLRTFADRIVIASTKCGDCPSRS